MNTTDKIDKKEKARWARILRVYGITKEQYEEIDTGFCPICLREWSDAVQPVVDHDHVNLMIRGVVCRYCNHRRIGHHRDPEIVFRIYKYLKGPFMYEAPPKKKKRKRKSGKKNTTTT